MSILVKDIKADGFTLPLGIRFPRERLDWCLVFCPEGKEATTCAKVRQIIPTDILKGALVLRKENQFKRHGEFQTEVVDFLKGYFVVATKDALYLLAQTLDKGHVVRLSWDEIVSDVLYVQGRLLVGHECRVAKFNRRRARAFLRVDEGDGASATLNMPLTMLARR